MKGLRLAAGVLLAAIVLFVLPAEWTAPSPYEEQYRDSIEAGTSAAFPLGTDALGRDRLSRLAAIDEDADAVRVGELEEAVADRGGMLAIHERRVGADAAQRLDRALVRRREHRAAPRGMQQGQRHLLQRTVLGEHHHEDPSGHPPPPAGEVMLQG